MLPPLRHFWPTYILILVLLCGIVWVGGTYLARLDFQKHPTAFFIFGSAAIAVATLLLNLWMQWRTTRTQQTLTVLQALRTDSDYLTAATVVKSRLHGQASPAPQAILDELTNQQAPAPKFKDIDFPNAVEFVLNQYEFLATGAQLGVLDRALLDETIAVAVTGAMDQLAPYIAQRREDNPEIWKNLVWYYRRYQNIDASHPDARKLGPKTFGGF